MGVSEVESVSGYHQKHFRRDSQPPPLVHGKGNDRVDDILEDNARAGAGGVGRCTIFKI